MLCGHDMPADCVLGHDPGRMQVVDFHIRCFRDTDQCPALRTAFLQ